MLDLPTKSGALVKKKRQKKSGKPEIELTTSLINLIIAIINLIILAKNS